MEKTRLRYDVTMAKGTGFSFLTDESANRQIDKQASAAKCRQLAMALGIHRKRRAKSLSDAGQV